MAKEKRYLAKKKYRPNIILLGEHLTDLQKKAKEDSRSLKNYMEKVLIEEAKKKTDE